MKLNLNQIDNLETRENFKKLSDEFESNPIFNTNWKLFDIEFTASSTKTIYHKLGYRPIDLIETFKTGAGAITYNYDSFDSETISVTSTGVARVRFIIGRMK